MAWTSNNARTGSGNASDIRSLVATATRGCQSDRDKAIALWAYIARRPFYHWDVSREHPEFNTELGFVLDPISDLNVHGQVICFEVIDTLGTMAEVAGIETRSQALPGHMVLEMFYDDKWHLFDAQYDCASYHIGDDGQTVLDHSKICTNTNKYIINQEDPSDPFYQFDHFGGKFWAWGSKQWVADHFYTGGHEVYATRISWGHTIQFHLRRGERLVRTFKDMGKWYLPASCYSSSWPGLPGGPADPHDPRNPKNKYANGVLTYEPDWKAHENNFLDGLYEGKNYVLADGKAHPAGPGECYLIFRVASPYLIVGKLGELNQEGDSHDGAIFQAGFYRKSIDETNSIAISLDNGLSWKTVWVNDQTGQNHLKLDLTSEVEGRYHYLIKVTLLADEPADASLANLKLTNHLFYSPVPLPAVKAGENRFKFNCKEQENVMIIRPDMADNPGYLRFFHELHNLSYSSSYSSHLSPPGRTGYATIQVKPPAGSKVHWLTVDGMYSAALYTSPVRDKAVVLCRADYDPVWKWRTAFKDDFRYSSHWRQERTADIMLPRPADTCYVKFRLYKSSRISLNGCKIYAHYLRPEPALPPGSVKITHMWSEDGQLKTYTVVPSLSGHTYTITAAGNKIDNRAIIFDVANERTAPAQMLHRRGRAAP